MIMLMLILIFCSVLRGRDPSAVAVLLEDSAAVTGVFLASAALGLTHWTGNTVYDAIGSITIGGAWKFNYNSEIVNMNIYF